jgi:hypothetical protein
LLVMGWADEDVRVGFKGPLKVLAESKYVNQSATLPLSNCDDAICDFTIAHVTPILKFYIVNCCSLWPSGQTIPAFPALYPINILWGSI